MIKLVVTSEFFPSITQCFDTCPITIGNLHSPTANLKLPDQSLQDVHLQIHSQKVEGKTVFFISNVSNDPFASLNGLPFGKQQIGNNDLIQVGEVSIRFEIDSPTNPSPEAPPHEPHLSHKEESSFQRRDASPLERKPTSTPPLTINSLAAPNANTSPSSRSPNHQGKATGPLKDSPPLSLKDYYLSEYDDENDTPNSKRDTPPKNLLPAALVKKWRILLSFIGVFAFVGIVASAIVLFWVSDQSEEHEIHAGKAVADVAMALTFAQLKHIHAQNQNWSNPDFVANNMNGVLAPGYQSLAQFDSHGLLGNCSYMIRIYTSGDLSNFLIIAQPEPSLLHWLMPKASIVIDSHAMEIRKVKDLKVLNRLLVTASNLEGINAREISNLIKQGELIPLSVLAGKRDKEGFEPPKYLAMMRPGAENLVYNAPRYYLLGEALLKAACVLAKQRGSKGTADAFQQEVAALIKYPDLVLYSSLGIEYAMEAQKALSIIAPYDKFLVATLQVNGKKQITSSKLLMEETNGEIAVSEHRLHPYSFQADDEVSEVSEATDSPNDIPPPSEPKTEEAKEPVPGVAIDEGNTVYLQLTALAAARQNTLGPLNAEIADLLNKHSQSAVPDFSIRLAALIQRYNEADKNENAKIHDKLDLLLRESSRLPASSLIDFVKAANLYPHFQNYLTQLKKEGSTYRLTDQDIEQQISQIEGSGSWEKLERASYSANQLLQFQNIPDEGRLVAFQNSVRHAVTQKLNQFILSSDSPLPVGDFVDENLQILTNILNAAWITDQETYDFYLAEFELREPAA